MRNKKPAKQLGGADLFERATNMYWGSEKPTIQEVAAMISEFGKPFTAMALVKRLCRIDPRITTDRVFIIEHSYKKDLWEGLPFWKKELLKLAGQNQWKYAWVEIIIAPQTARDDQLAEKICELIENTKPVGTEIVVRMLWATVNILSGEEDCK